MLRLQSLTWTCRIRNQTSIQNSVIWPKRSKSLGAIWCSFSEKELGQPGVVKSPWWTQVQDPEHLRSRAGSVIDWQKFWSCPNCFYLVQVIFWFVWLWHPIRGLLECLLTSGLESCDQGDCYNLISQHGTSQLRRATQTCSHHGPTELPLCWGVGIQNKWCLKSRALRWGARIISSADNWSHTEFQCRCNVVFKLQSHPASWGSRSQATFELSPRFWHFLAIMWWRNSRYQHLHTGETVWLCLVQCCDTVVILTGSSDSLTVVITELNFLPIPTQYHRKFQKRK